MLGPLLTFDLIRLARRGRSTAVRVLYLVALLLALWRTEASYRSTRDGLHGYRTPPDPAELRNLRGHLALDFACTLFIVQNIAVFVLTPIYLGTVITEQRERGTLDLLLTSQASDGQLILGFLFSRLSFLGGTLLGGLPVLALVQLLGGVDMPFILLNFALTAVNLVLFGSLCLCVSATTRTMLQSAIVSYALSAGMVFLLAGTDTSPFLFLDNSAAGQSSFSMLGRYLWILAFVGGLSLIAARVMLRDLTSSDYNPNVWSPASARDKLARDAESATGQMPSRPPVWDDALLWKEATVPRALLRLIFVSVALCALGFFFIGVDVLFSRPYDFDKVSHPGVRSSLVPVVRFFSFLLLAVGLPLAGYRAAGTIAQERERRTWLILLTLPVSRRELLRAKWRGALYWGIGCYGVAAGLIVLEHLLAGLHFFSLLLRLSVPLLQLLFLVTVGLCLSFFARTALQAYLRFTLVLLGLLIAPLLAGLIDPTRGFLRAFSRTLCPATLWEGLLFNRPEQLREWIGDNAGLAAGLTFYIMGCLASWLVCAWAIKSRS